MKKLLAIILTLIASISCFAFTACDGGNDGDLSNQETATLYKDIAVQMWQKIGVSNPTISKSASANSGLSTYGVVIPDKKTETNEEGPVYNIKVNASDAAGIIYLMGNLYADQNYVTTNGVACFDVSYEVYGEHMNQTLCLRSEINKSDEKVIFEAIVITPAYSSVSYTYAEIYYNFNTSTLKSCRFIMSWDGEYVDMALTEDGRYMWYEPTSADNFTSAVDAMFSDFDQKRLSLTKLTANFDRQMQDYVAVSMTAKGQLQNGGNNGGNGGNGDNGGNDVIQGGEETDKPIGPTEPINQQVSETVWNGYLNLTDEECFYYSLHYGESMSNSINYRCQGNNLEKITCENFAEVSFEIFTKEADKYFKYSMDVHTKEMTTTEIDKQTYDAVFAEMKVDFSQIFVQSEFEYQEMIGCYTLSQLNEMNEIFVRFNDGKLESISYYKNGIQYSYNFYFENTTVEVPRFEK